MSYILTFLTALFFLTGVPAVHPADTDDSINRIQKAYDGLRDIRGRFTQKSTIRDLGRTDTYKGDFAVKPPLRMKWSYRGADAQDLIVNKDTVLIYKKGDKQAYRSRFDREAYGQAPVALLSGFGKMTEEFTITSRGDNTLILKPKAKTGTLVSITVTVSHDAFPIRSFAIYDKRSNVIEIELTDVVLNSGVKDSVFDLVVPRGVSVFDQPF